MVNSLAAKIPRLFQRRGKRCFGCGQKCFRSNNFDYWGNIDSPFGNMTTSEGRKNVVPLLIIQK